MHPYSGRNHPEFDDNPIYALHRGGKIEIRPSIRVRDRAGLALAYTPGVADVSRTVAARPDLAYDYTWKSNTILIVTDGTAVLGLGDIGPLGALPVMEGKALLFKEFGAVDAIPMCLATTDIDEIVETVVRIAPGFGGVNLEDISGPRCFQIESQLQERLDIPVFHDDQHGTAVVVLAAMINACRVTGRALADLRIVISGAGAAGIAVTRTLLDAGARDIIVLDSQGIISQDRDGLTGMKLVIAARTNPRGLSGDVGRAMNGADAFIGVSAGRIGEDIVATMNTGAIIFALANPDPEVHPTVARHYAAVVATGRSDFPNQINNVLAFPGIFRGALDIRARSITPGMRLAAAHAIADVVGDDADPDYIIPSPFDPRVAVSVSRAVVAAAQADGAARLSWKPTNN